MPYIIFSTVLEISKNLNNSTYLYIQQCVFLTYPKFTNIYYGW